MAQAPPVVLSIAGSDSGGGAGIQADLKAFARCGVHGATAITAITAQNTVAVEAVSAVAPEMIVAQIRAVAEDLRPAAVKIGMVGGEAAIDAVLEGLALIGAEVPVVLDPVMVAESGARLLDPAAEQALVGRLLPRVDVVTPNVPEALALAGLEQSPADAEVLARAVLAAGARAVVLTGGHRHVAEDVLLAGADAPAERIAGPRHPDGAAHGSGCTHASVLAAGLASGLTLPEAARRARRLAGEAVEHGLRGLGAGSGPVDVLAPVIASGPRRVVL